MFRQKDVRFVSLLDDIRYGRNVFAALQALVAICKRPLVNTVCERACVQLCMCLYALLRWAPRALCWRASSSFSNLNFAICAQNGIRPTQLFSRNKDVDDVNSRELGQLPGAPASFGSIDDVEVDPVILQGGDSHALNEATNRLNRHEFFRDCQASATVSVKVRGRVQTFQMNWGGRDAIQLIGPVRKT